LPDLSYNYLNNQVNQPKIRIYEGQSQLIYLLDELLDELKSGDEFLNLNEGEDFNQLIGNEMLHNWINKRVQKQVSIRTIIQSNNILMQQSMLNNQKELRQTKIIPFEKSNYPGSITIINNKIIFWDTVMYQATVITNQTTSNLFRSIFESFWALL
jgi:hypothetical protein